MQHAQNIAAPFLQADPLPLLTLDPITNRLALAVPRIQDDNDNDNNDAISGHLTNSHFFLRKSRERVAQASAKSK